MLVTFLIAVTNLADSLKKRGVIVPYGFNGRHVSHRSGMAAGAEGVGRIALPPVRKKTSAYCQLLFSFSISLGRQCME